jgi:asparagine synthetase B (glutamine-hydrolysing)
VKGEVEDFIVGFRHVVAVVRE